MIFAGDTRNKLFQSFYQVRWIRKAAKFAMNDRDISQGFHGGVIFCDAVDHSWAWIHGPKYETFDRDLQDFLLAKSFDHRFMIDIGCNVGAMSLACLLRNPEIRMICVDPNPRAVKLLKRSLRQNGLANRAKVFEVALSSQEGARKCRYELEGSVTGHISDTGSEVSCINFADFVNDVMQDDGRVLIKIDVEGYETKLFQSIGRIRNLNRAMVVAELHPRGWNGIGDPSRCLRLLENSGATFCDMRGAPLRSANDSDFTQVCAVWPLSSAIG